MLNHNWQFLLGLGVSAGLLFVLVYQVDLAEMRDALMEANYLYLVPAIVLYFVAVYFRSVRWRYLLSPLRLLSVGRLYPVVIIGYMANNLLPARLGEVVRSYYLARRERIHASSALGTIAVERVYDGVTLLAWAAVAGPTLLLLGEFDGVSDTSRTTWIVLTTLTVALFVGALGVLTCLAVVPRFTLYLDRLIGFVPARFQPKARQLAQTFVEGLSILNSPRKHLGLFLLSLPVWGFEGGMYFLIGHSFGIDDYFGSTGVFMLVVVLLTATSNLATSVPSSIGGIGPFEVVAQQTLMALGVGASVAGAYVGFLHLVALWLPVNLAGLVLLWQQNLSLKGLTQAPQTGPPVHETAGRYLIGEARGPAIPPKEDPS